MGAHGNVPWGSLNNTQNGGASHYAILQGLGASIWQTISGLSPGKRYVLTFMSANRPIYGGGLENLAVAVDGRPLPGSVFQPDNAFTVYSLIITPWNVSIVLEFSNARYVLQSFLCLSADVALYCIA